MERGYGEYAVTGTRLGILLDHLTAVDKKYSGAFDRKQFTDVIGASPTSNGPAEKLKDMVEFGLLLKDTWGYVITDIGKAAIHGEGVEKNATIEKIIRTIPLWNQLLNAIGNNPDRKVFLQAFERIVHLNEPISKRNLDRLWHAYLEDISCITKTPPYSRGSALLGRQKNLKVSSKLKIKKSLEKNVLQSKIPNDRSQTVSTPQSRPRSVGRTPFTKITLDVGGIKFEVKDASSIMVARFLLNALEDKLPRGDDYG